MRLPTEPRHMIWRLAMPRRLIIPLPQEGVCFPGPPVLAQACRDSRAVSLKHGSAFSSDSDRLVWSVEGHRALVP